MNILIIRNYPSYIDIKYNTYNIQEIGLAKALVEKGHKCDVLFWTDKEDEDIEIKLNNIGIKIFYRKSKVLLKNAIFTDIDELLNNYDIIQPCEYNQYEALYLAKRYPNKTVIYHGPYYSKFNKKYNLICKIFDIVYLRHYIKRGTKFIVKSKLAKNFLENKGIKEQNITVAGVGIDVEMLSPYSNDKIPSFINKVKDSKYDYKLLYIGKWEKRRNIKLLFDILKKVSDSGYNVCLVMVGNGNEKYKEECIQYAKKIDVYSKILHTDKLEQRYLSYIYEACEIFLLPTSYEIFGMVLLEAMYYGLPVVTTFNGGSDILIKNNENGIIEELDSLKWSQTIIKLINNTEKRKYIGKMANKTIVDKYTWNSVSKNILKAYEDRVGLYENFIGK